MRRNHLNSLAAATLLGLLAVLAQGDASAQSQGMCCVHSTSKLDGLVNPVVGGDENFFTIAAGKPAVVIALDTNSEKMKGWLPAWPTTVGCAHGTFGNAYSPTTIYKPLKDRPAVDDDNWFAPASLTSTTNKYYRVTGNDGCGALGSSPSSDCDPETSISDSNICGANAACQTCLNTKGYYVHDATRRAATGQFLNLYGPKDIGSVTVLSHLLADYWTAGERIALVTTGGNKIGSSHPCWTGDCVCIPYEWEPRCNDDGTRTGPNSSINSVFNNFKKINWTSTCSGTTKASGASLLYAAASYLRTSDSTYGTDPFPATWSKDTDFKESGNRAVCADCEPAAVILISGGATNNASNSDLVTLPSDITSQSISCPGCAAGDPNLPKVAKWISDHDIRTDTAWPAAHKNRVSTYVIGYHAASDVQTERLLRRTALMGGGKYYTASSAAELKERLEEALNDIAAQPTTFASAAIATMQTSSTELSAVIPRLRPHAVLPWKGDLYRFKQYNEFIEDTGETDGGFNTADMNKDGDLDDVFVLDTSDTMVVDNDESEFVRGQVVDNTATLDPDDKLVIPTTTAATPHWDARANMKSAGYDARSIWTVVDDKDATGTAAATGDGRFTSSDSMVSFEPSQWATVAPYLGVLGSVHCPTVSPASNGRLIDRFGFTSVTAANAALPAALQVTGFSTTSQSHLNELCVKLLIQYTRGQDLADEDADGSSDDVRDTILGDIFHSSPVNVDPPVDRFLCDMGLHNQCLRTLYASATDLGGFAMDSAAYTTQTVTIGGQICQVPMRAAYDKYRFDNRKRDKLILVGANDGMVHAFNSGSATETCVGGTLEQSYDEGTGTEEWAFIPPDQLPRLIDRVYGQLYMVDGDVMVRDVWADGSGIAAADGIKQSDEFHTLAIVAEGRGGNHYVAMEIPFSSNTPVNQPSFRWIFPQPCTDEATEFGKTLMALAPRPPPIGPVLLENKNTGGAVIGVPGKSYTWPGDGAASTFAERWVAMLPGGWSPARTKGRGIYMVDAWWGNLSGEAGVTGARTDNLWWKIDYGTDSSEQTGPRSSLTHGVAAPVAMVDYGANDTPSFDGFFDTGVVGDMGGQVWVSRFHRPGKLNASTHLVSNWTAGRAFQMDKDGTTVAKRSPFGFLASLGIEPGTNKLRAMLGAGDRNDLRSDNAGSCGFNDPSACGKYSCTTDVQYDTTRLNQTRSSRIQYAARVPTAAVPTVTAITGSTCGTAGQLDAGTSVASGTYSHYDVSSCTLTDLITGSNVTLPSSPLQPANVKCAQDAAGNFRCENAATASAKLKTLGNPSSVTGLGNNRFFGLWVYGGTTARTFDEDRTTTAAGHTTAKQFDTGRLSDRTTGNTTSGDLKNAALNTDAVGPNGWYFEYAGLNHKTSSAGTLVAGCSFWNVVYPNPLTTGSACPENVTTTARLFQADFLTGNLGCAAGFVDGLGNPVRYVQRTVEAPPPEPAAVMQVSKSGKTRISALLQDGAAATNIAVSTNLDVLQSIYEMPISRELHECRHVTGGTCTPNVP